MQTSQRATVGTALLLGAVLAIAVLGVAPGVAAQEANQTETGNVSFGAQVSAFMQSTAADANGTVDRGMWAQSAANASNPGAVVSERARQLQERIDRLERRSAELSAQANGSGMADPVYTARASAVRAELANLRSAVDQTAATAQARGVDTDQLTTLRERAGNVRGPEVAAAARTLTSGGQGPPEQDPEPTEQGPSTDRPGANPGDGTTAGPGNQSDAGQGEGGQPDDRGNGGAPDSAGNSDAGGGDGDAPDNAGSGGGADAGNGNPSDGAENGDDAGEDSSDDSPGSSEGGQGNSGGEGGSSAGGNGGGGNSAGGNSGDGSDNGGNSGGGGGNSGGSGNDEGQDNGEGRP